MAMAQPFFETVTIPPDRSLLVFDRRLPEFPFNWHYHPEFELTLTVGSRGMRFVGDDVAAYDDGDLVLLAPNLPHAFQSRDLTRGAEAHRAMICWFTESWASGLMAAVPEMRPLGPLLAQARRGLCFGAPTAARLGPDILRLGALDPPGQVLALQSILLALAAAPDRRTLARGEVDAGALPRDRMRMRRILDHLHATYDQPLRLAPICARVHLTPSQLQRVFKRSTRMSISAYVAQLRMGRACQMLAGTDLPIGRIATDCGFADAADFARRFRAARGTTPSAWRAGFGT